MFEMTNLDYSFESLQPYISKEIMELHYSKHYKNYLDKFNDAISKYPQMVENKSLREIIQTYNEFPEDIKQIVRNNGGGYYNHKMLWKMLTPKENSIMSEKLKTILVTAFGSLEAMYDEIIKCSLGIFGSGWSWIALDPQTKSLEVLSTPNQDSPTMYNKVPILGIDVWEHAYYIDYKNDRKKYVEAIFNIINWDYIEERYIKHMNKLLSE